MDIENEEPGQLAGFQSCVQRLQESIEMMQQSLQKAVQEPKVVYNLSGATIQGSVIGGSIIPADEGGGVLRAFTPFLDKNRR